MGLERRHHSHSRRLEIVSYPCRDLDESITKQNESVVRRADVQREGRLLPKVQSTVLYSYVLESSNQTLHCRLQKGYYWLITDGDVPIK